MTEIISNEDQEEIYKKAAYLIASAIRDMLQNKDYAVFAVPGGRSVARIFSKLKRTNVPWKQVHIFMVDERLVPLESPDSNFKLANDYFIRELISEGKLPEGNVHPFHNTASADHGTESYAEELKKLGGAYDIVLLSSGEDGHIGALYPNHHSIRDDSEYYIWMSDSPKPPARRMSMSRKLLLRAKVAIVLFIGEAKREAYIRFHDKKIKFSSCPVKLVNDIKEAYAITDIRWKKEN